MMKPALLLASLLILAWIPTTATATLASLPSGECDGIVDVACTDYTSCWHPDPCEPQPYRECLVWYMYLDLTPAPEYDGVLCEDQPYRPNP